MSNNIQIKSFFSADITKKRIYTQNYHAPVKIKKYLQCLINAQRKNLHVVNPNIFEIHVKLSY